MSKIQSNTENHPDNICIVHAGDLSVPSGGTDRVVHIATGLTDLGIDVSLVVPEPDGRVPANLKRIDMHPIRRPTIDSKLLLAAKLTRRAKRIANRQDAVLQIEHSSLAGVAALLGCSGFVLDMHDLVFPSPRFEEFPLVPAVARMGVKTLEKLAVTSASHIFVVSSPIKEVLHQEWGITDSKVSVVPNGFSPDEVDQYADTDTVEGRVGFIGTLHPKLNIDAFVEMAKRSEVDSVVVIGDGMLYDELEESVKQGGVTDKVMMTGQLPGEEAYELLATSEVFVYPVKASEHTRMLSGVKIYDYAALERPMVLDDVSESDVWACFESEDAAVFADPDDVSDFVDKICELLDDESRRDEIAANARALVHEYEWNNQVEKIGSKYFTSSASGDNV